MDGNGVILINDAVLLLKKIAGITSIVYSHLSSDTGAAHISSDTEAAHISFDTEAKIFISEFKTREGSKVKLTANAAAGVSLNLSYQDANLLDIKTFGISAIHQDGDAIQIVWLNTNEDGNIVELEFEGNPILNVADVVVSDSSGNLISAQIIYNPMVEDTILLANYPNPFNPETWIPFQLKESSDVAITIYDQTGHLIKRINLGRKEAGRYVKKGDAVYWDGKNENGESVAGGLYFYTITAGNFKATRKMIVIK
jgi:hypothetical protein